MPDSVALTLSPTLEHALVYVATAVATLVAFTHWRRSDMRAFRELLVTFFAVWFIQGALFAATAAPNLIPLPLARGLDLAGVVLLTWGFTAPALPSPLGGVLLGGGLTISAALGVFSLSAARITGAEPAWMAALWPFGVLGLCAIALIVILATRSADRTAGTLAAFGALALSAGLDALTLSDLAGVCRLIAFWLLPIGLYQRALGELRAARETLREFSQVALTQTQELVTLLETSAFLFTTFDIDELLGKVIDQAAIGVDFDRGLIALTDPAAPQMMRVVCTYPRGFMPGESTFLIQSQPAVASAVSRGEQVSLGRRGQGASPLARLFNADPPHEAIIQPLSTQDDTLGVFIAANILSQRAFDDRQRRVLEALGAQLAAAVSNARMYLSLDMQARELARVLALREREITLNTAMIESIAEGVVVANELDYVIAANAASARILDTPRDQLLSRPFGLVFERLTPLGGLARPGETSSAEGEAVRATFQYGARTIQVSITPSRSPLGDRLGRVAVFRDVTREHAAEQGRIRFVGSLVQELRAPLDTIKGYAELLAREAAGTLPSAAHGFVETIRANAERLGAQVNAVQQFHELDRGRIELNVEETDVASLLAESADEHRPRLAARRLSLEINVKPNLPTVRADRARVRQVLDQLIDNARKFTPEGGRIRLAAAPSWDGRSLERPAHVAVTVEDSGRGFASHDSERLFEQFYRIDDPDQVDQPGLGVGLTIARGLCEAMGGHLWATGARALGAKFTFILPVARVTETQTKTDSASEESLEAWIERTLTFPEDDPTN